MSKVYRLADVESLVEIYGDELCEGCSLMRPEFSIGCWDCPAHGDMWDERCERYGLIKTLTTLARECNIMASAEIATTIR